jgi:2-keto-4-pentenoate hydratase/2-oxohepta-3-ene-1,7-dioic acid hydratase in catechol pathway
MKIARFNFSQIGFVVGEVIYDVTPLVPSRDTLESLSALKHMSAAQLAEIRATADAYKLSEVHLNSPIDNASKVVAAPINYQAHVDEMLSNGQAFGHIITDIRKAGLFLKAPSSVVGPSDGIKQRFLDRRTDHEIELCAVIGKAATCVSKDKALEYVAGYCLGLDITVRGSEDRSFRKSIDTYTVLGPWLVSADEGIDPTDVALQLKVNGTIQQDANTSDMVMSVAELIEYASSFYTLLPGDVLMTGTPQGVGPIRPGDVLIASAQGLGSMTVKVNEA